MFVTGVLRNTHLNPEWKEQEMSIHVDCQNCGRVVTLSDRGASGTCKCGTRFRLITKGDTISIDHYLPGGHLKKGKGNRSNRSSKKAKGRSPSVPKPVKRLFVNFVAVMIFVSCMVVVLAAYGGG